MNDKDNITIEVGGDPKYQQELQARIARLEEENSKLKALNEQKDKFLAIISHDLRSPFTSLLAFTRFAADHFESFSRDELKEVMEDMRYSAENLYSLLENLLIWTKTQQGKVEYHPSYVDLHDVVTQNITLFATHTERKQITLRNVIPRDVEVFVDHWMIDLVLQHLLSNAVKFTRAQGEVTVAATQRDRDVVVSISDTGIGIDEEDLPKLFRIDIRYKGVGTYDEQGTGLGLLICKSLIETNGGTIWVESHIEKGTTVTFTVPRAYRE